MFHNICDFIKDELKELDRKIAAGNRLTTQEIEYADLLAHMKKSILTVEAMEEAESDGYFDSSYSRGGNYSRGNMAGRGRYARRGRYSASRSYRDDDGSMKEDIFELMEKAPNERVKHKLEDILSEME